MNRYPLLSSINGPDNLKALPAKKLGSLAREIRRLIIEVVSANGGHLASNLGVVELTIALHRVFESPQDKIIWDVGHQCYTHKLICGRREKFSSLRRMGGISGFPKRAESEHDIVDTGHASTSISAALGILEGMSIRKTAGKVVAVIGDGALTGGMALEALNYTSHLGKGLIIILNDNNMSISDNVGAISSHLSRLTATPFYQVFRRHFDNGVRQIPFVGEPLMRLIYRMKKGMKALIFRETLFSDFGFEYIGPIDGHNIRLLTSVLSNIRRIDNPVVVHVTTVKGKGYIHAEGNPTLYHGVSPFSILDGKIESKGNLTFTHAFSGIMTKLAAEDKRIVCITAAMTDGTGLSLFKARYPGRFYDVGIAEQHAVTFAAGLATAGLRPVVAIYSTFMQRAIDQVIHDVVLPGLPVILAVDRAGVVGEDGETHHGVFDIPLLRSIPSLTILSPATKGEMERMFRYALSLDKPVVIRYPKAVCAEESPPFSLELTEGRGIHIEQHDGRVLLIGVGGIITEVQRALKVLADKKITADLYNLRFIKPIDEEYLANILADYEFVALVEEGIAQGGIGEY
ncbi:MAG TPA: 1-deoxy-D-xylulose-5-phosphate synthase, partial [Spirochaetales bacterium]|nr:1-deoxy-D-xylulose-5-phosphate synthase [Spirochaetales bacterium]